MDRKKKLIDHFLSATGIQINGPNPWDIQVKDERFFSRVLKDGSLGLGESYMDGWWDCPLIDEFVYRLLKEGIDRKVKGNIQTFLFYLAARVLNLQSRLRASIIAQRHYNLGNDLFFSFLDPYKQYSCAYFQDTDDLTQAQEKKLDLLCRKLQLKPSDHLLDIGGGWGGLARWAAEKYGCSVTVVNISEEQNHFAREFCKGLPVKIIEADYRHISGDFDKIVSVGMFEHVGYKNYRTFMEVVYRSLKDGGIFLLHTIGGNASRVNCDPWINRYIFPNGMLPSLAQISRAVEDLFVIEDLHNLGPHYEKTLLSWNKNFQKNWPKLASRYDERFKRMWEFYLLSCAGSFRARHIQLWQLVMTKIGTPQPPCRVM